MKNKRVIKGNFTTLPTGADVLAVYETNAVTEKSLPGEGALPLSNEESVIASRDFMIENKK